MKSERSVSVMTQNIPEIYGSLIFNDRIMRSKLPKDMYKALKNRPSKMVLTWSLMLQTPCCSSHERMGNRKWCYSLYTLVPAYDKCNSRETRQLHFSNRRWTGDHGFLRKRTCKKVNRMLPVFHPAVFVLLLKQEDTQYGIQHHRPSLKTEPFTFLQHSMFLQR